MLGLIVTNVDVTSVLKYNVSIINLQCVGPNVRPTV